MSHLLHLCMHKSQTASELHGDTSMFWSPVQLYNHSSEPWGRADKYIWHLENKATNHIINEKQEILQHCWKVSDKKVLPSPCVKRALVPSTATTATQEQEIPVLCSHRVNTRFRRHCPNVVNSCFLFMLLSTKHLHRPLSSDTSTKPGAPSF